MFIFILHVKKRVQLKSNAVSAPAASSDPLRKLMYATLIRGVDNPVHEIN